MRRRTAAIIVACVVLCGCAAAPVPDTADLVAKVPADGSVDGQKIAAELVASGPEGIRAVCQRLVPPGTGDDAKEQQALSGLAMYVSRPGAEAERKMFVEVLVEALETAGDNEVKAFLIRQLQLAGKDEAVGPLSKLLTDDRLCEPATQALLAIRTPKAQGALAEALARAEGARRVTLVRALAELAPEEAARRRAASLLFRVIPGGVRIRTTEVVQALIKDATSEDTNIRRAALYALANMGAPSAADVLAKAAQAEAPFERATATSCYLLLARRLAEDGHKDACVKVCRDLLATRTAPQDANVQCAALSRLVATLGK
ncbi:MAG: HEAT repeat domain-containing protein, partial [Planctomycetes bacterium]|nr:HEAT repeat domain-containing protein [Planctomycetota bacterium]